MLVTKDEDFLLLSVNRGCPSKVVYLAIGNASNAETAAFLLHHADAMERFAVHPEAGFLLLDPASTGSGRQDARLLQPPPLATGIHEVVGRHGAAHGHRRHADAREYPGAAEH